MAVPGCSTLTIESPDKVSANPSYFNPAIEGVPHTVELAPGGTFRTTVFMSFAFMPKDAIGVPPTFQLPAEGTWKVRAGFESANGVRIAAKPLSITIKEDPTIPKSVRDVFGTASWHKMVLLGGATEEELQRYYDQVMSGVKGHQGDIVAYLVGSRFQSNGRHKEALTLFNTALASGQKSLNDSIVKLRIVRSQAALGDGKGALAVLDGINTDDIDGPIDQVADLRKAISNSLKK
jgi:hypothetical protein